MKRLLALLLVVVMCVGALASCGDKKKKDDTNPANAPAANSYVYGEDYISLYDQFGADVTIDQVTEDPETGFASITVDGTTYVLGLDFLSMAMVYNNEVPANHDVYKTADDVYAGWWKLYIQRWNALLPEIPLYANEYYDFYNKQITGVAQNPTNPYWGPASALIDWDSTKSDKSIIIGSSTELSGKFRYSSFGASNPSASDLDIEGLISGYSTVVANKLGGYQWDTATTVKSYTEVINNDGTKTFTIEINSGLKYSDGSEVKAADYLITALVFSSPVGAAAAGKDHQAAMTIVGYDSFAKYNGTAAEGTTKYLSGLRLLGDYKFSVTISADYLPYYYDITYAGFTPTYPTVWLGANASIKDDGQGAYIDGDFYDKTGDTYKLAAHIKASSTNTNKTYPCSGPYVVASYDKSTKTATLEKNPYYVGNFEGVTPKIEKVIYKFIVDDTQLQDFKSGNLDILAGVTGGEATDEAIAYADANSAKAGYTHYSRAGYGKLGFRADYGPAQFVEVRQAIAYCMDRATFAKDFTGGYGGVVDGPYYTGSWMYKAAVEMGMTLTTYATSLDTAIELLEEGGWVYDKNGNAYKSGVRYKKIAAADINENDRNYQSKDGTYKTTYKNGYFYMPLVINWYGTTPNEFTDLLMTGFASNDNIEQAGMVVQYQTGDFGPMLDELYQLPVYGFYAGTPMYNAFNFATGFTSAAYDYSYNLTIDPTMYVDGWNAYYIKDSADFYWLK